MPKQFCGLPKKTIDLPVNQAREWVELSYDAIMPKQLCGLSKKTIDLPVNQAREWVELSYDAIKTYGDQIIDTRKSNY